MKVTCHLWVATATIVMVVLDDYEWKWLLLPVAVKIIVSKCCSENDFMLVGENYCLYLLRWKWLSILVVVKLSSLPVAVKMIVSICCSDNDCLFVAVKHRFYLLQWKLLFVAVAVKIIVSICCNERLFLLVAVKIIVSTFRSEIDCLYLLQWKCLLAVNTEVLLVLIMSFRDRPLVCQPGLGRGYSSRNRDISRIIFGNEEKKKNNLPCLCQRKLFSPSVSLALVHFFLFLFYIIQRHGILSFLSFFFLHLWRTFSFAERFAKKRKMV